MLSQKKLLEYHNRGSAEDKERDFRLIRLDIVNAWNFIQARSWSESTPNGTPIVPVLEHLCNRRDFAKLLAMQRKLSALARAYDAFEKHFDSVGQGGHS